MQLYGYFRSSASFRVRIALNLKGLPYDYRSVHLVRGGGEQLSPQFRALNPDGLVPVLVDDARDPPLALPQSLAIVEYLEEVHPEPPLLPREASERARVRLHGARRVRARRARRAAGRRVASDGRSHATPCGLVVVAPFRIIRPLVQGRCSSVGRAAHS